VWSLCRNLIREDRPVPVDLIFVLAGRPERKRHGLELFRQGLAPRLILSVDRFEVRPVSRFGLAIEPELLPLARETTPDRRHFFVDLQGDTARASVRPTAVRGTYRELASLAEYLSTDPIRSIAMVSTSLHLRRIAWCCEHLPFLRGKQIRYLAVPEELSTFQCRGWWRRADHWSYLTSEYLKLAFYHLRYGCSPRTQSEARNQPPS
jgi:hypothetical protein